MNTGKTISLAKARADFGALLRLAERFGMVKIMHGIRVVAVLTANGCWRENRKWERIEAELAAVAKVNLPAKPSKRAKKKPGK